MKEDTHPPALPRILLEPDALLADLAGSIDSQPGAAALTDPLAGAQTVRLFETFGRLKQLSDKSIQCLRDVVISEARRQALALADTSSGSKAESAATLEYEPGFLENLAILRDAELALGGTPALLEEPCVLATRVCEAIRESAGNAQPLIARSLSASIWILLQDLWQQASPAKSQACALGLDSLLAMQDPQSGLWPAQAGATPLERAICSARIISILETLRRPILHIRRLIDSTLRLQKPGGLFSNDDGDGTTELCLTGMLGVLSRLTDYRRDDVKTALFGAFSAICTRLKNIELELRGDGQCGKVPGPLIQKLTNLAFASLSIVRLYRGDFPQAFSTPPARPQACGYFAEQGRLTALETSLIENCFLLKAPEAVAHPMASVIVLCYNLGRYLPDAVASVIAQTWRDFELVIVDDGSTDEHTKLILDEMTRAGFCVRSHENMGQARAKNNAIRQTSGRYVCALDADDLYHPDFLKKTTTALEADPELGIATCHYDTFDGYSSIVAPESCTLESQLAANEIPVAALFRRATFEKTGGYFDKLHGIEDWDLWLQMLETGARATVIPEALFHYRIRENSMYTLTRSPERYERCIRTLTQRHEKSYREHFKDVLAARAAEFARLIEVWQNQQLSVSRLIEHSEKSTAAYLERIAGLEQAKAWLEKQWHNWEAVSKSAEKQLCALREQK